MLDHLWHALESRTWLIRAARRVARRRVPPGVGWCYVFGVATLVTFLTRMMTGLVLTTLYVPSTENAFESLQFITYIAPFGWLVRSIHYFGASALIFLMGVHALRSFLVGAFKFPREVTWLTGVVLLAVMVMMGFSGQLMRWDQGAIWSTVVAAEQAGRTPVIGTWLAHFILAGDNIGGATLTRFYAAHVLLLPGLMLLFILGHLALVVRHGVSEPPGAIPRLSLRVPGELCAPAEARGTALLAGRGLARSGRQRRRSYVHR